MEKTNVRELQDVVIRFSGDSGDGMQLTGTLFSDTSALLGNGISTFPDYPAEIRAPQGTVAGVSGFQVHFGSHRELNPGDYCDVLVAMNPAALKANRKWLKQGATVIIDGDSITEEHLRKAGFATLDPIAELELNEYNVVIPDITSMTREALKETGLDNKAVVKCKNMFALGICFYLFDRPEAYAYKYLETKFARKNPVVAQANKLAIDAGYNYAANTHQFANTYTVAPAPLGKGREVDERKTRRQPRPVFFRGQKPRNFFSVGGESRRKLFQDAHFFTVITHKSIPYKGANPRPYFLL